MSKTLPKDLTTYDLLKTLAVVLMIVDHVGFYFFLDENWFRVFGRMCVPIWFFLVGYANSRDLGARMWIGATVLIAGDLVAGLYLFPMNILATVIIVRLVLDTVMERALHNKSAFWAINAVLFFLILPSGMFLEYGTQGLILAILGWILRRRDEFAKAGDKELVNHYVVFALGTYIAVQSLIFGFDKYQAAVLMAGVTFVIGLVYFFKPAVLPRLSAAIPRPFVLLLQFTGRRTLEIYVGHLLLFKAMGMALAPDRFGLFQFGLIFTGFDS